jgi:glyoxylase-like metal-dependent hydrolase (beta-lactamase superfamily II)
MRQLLVCATVISALCGGAALAANAPLKLDYRRLAPGFIAETMNEAGFAAGTGFPAGNRWGQYTAYLMATNAKGQRTWRIEHYLPNKPPANTAQGSTMYLLEGSKQALLIDTANPASFTLGIDDLKTVVRQLLAHDNDGKDKANPLDFVVANTHSHGDHIGENVLMSDRTLYYMDGDWPALAPPNYVPIREGGGATAHGPGQAVAEIDLGDRLVKAVAVPPHTKGSTAYLDAENHMVFTGDAFGSGFAYIQGGPLDQFAQSAHHLAGLLAPLGHVDVLPAHFYQTALWERRGPPINGAPLDQTFVDDQAVVADGVLDGSIVGEPYLIGGRNTAWARYKSAQVVYSLSALYSAGATAKTPYHAMALKTSFPKRWVADDALTSIYNVKSDLHLIRGPSGEMVYWLKGSRASLLIGSGSGAPGLSALVAKLSRSSPLEIVVLDGSANQVAGLGQFANSKVYAPVGVSLGGRAATALAPGQVIDLGSDGAGRPLRLRIDRVADGPAAITLLDTGDRILFTGAAFGAQGPARPLQLKGPVAPFAGAFRAWKARVEGQFDSLYTTYNSQWFTSPQYLQQLDQALQKAQAADAAAPALVKSEGAPDIVAAIQVQR